VKRSSRKIYRGFLLIAFGVLIAYLGTDSVFGYNDRFYILVSLVFLVLVLLGGALLGQAVSDMQNYPPEPRKPK